VLSGDAARRTVREGADHTLAMRPQFDDIGVIQRTILTGIGQAVFAKSGSDNRHDS